MTLVLSLASAVLTFCASASSVTTPPAPSAATPPDKLVTVQYRKPVNGYKVQAYWLPMEVKFAYLIGPAIVKFTSVKDSSIFTVTNNHFTVPVAQVSLEYTDADSTDIKSIKSDTVRLLYHPVRSTGTLNLGTVDEPFFFADVNFDKTKELLMGQGNEGQRGGTTFEVFEMSEDDDPSLLTAVPFAYLDSSSLIDFTTKQIVISNSDGACGGSEDTYKLQPRTSADQPYRMALVDVAERQFDSKLSKCYELKYKVNPKTKQRTLLTKKELK